MSSVVSIHCRRLPTRAPKLVLPGRLGYLADAVAEGGPSMLPDEVGPGLRTQAEQAIAELEQLCAPATADVIEQWLEMVALSVGRNAPEPAMRKAHLGLVLSTSGRLPRVCWTVETRAGFSRHRGEKGAFWPSDGEVDAYLRPIGRPLFGQLRALKLLRDKGLASDQGGARTSGQPSSELEREAVTNSVAAALRGIAEAKAERDALLPKRAHAAPLHDVSASGQALGDLRRARFAALVREKKMLPNEVPEAYRTMAEP